MTLKELQPCTHIRHSDRVIEFEKRMKRYNAICPLCGKFMVWDNWTKLHEPLRAKCTDCGLTLPSTEINLEINSRKELNNETSIHDSTNSL